MLSQSSKVHRIDLTSFRRSISSRAHEQCGDHHAQWAAMWDATLPGEWVSQSLSCNGGAELEPVHETLVGAANAGRETSPFEESFEQLAHNLIEEFGYLLGAFFDALMPLLERICYGQDGSGRNAACGPLL